MTDNRARGRLVRLLAPSAGLAALLMIGLGAAITPAASANPQAEPGGGILAEHHGTPTIDAAYQEYVKTYWARKLPLNDRSSKVVMKFHNSLSGEQKTKLRPVLDEQSNLFHDSGSLYNAALDAFRAETLTKDQLSSAYQALDRYEELITELEKA